MIKKRILELKKWTPCLLLVVIIPYAVILKNYSYTHILWWFFFFLMLVSIFGCFITTLRMLHFKKKITLFLENIMANRYETGIEVGHHFYGGITSLEKLANKVSERLRKYEELCSDRVAVSYRAFDVLFKGVSDCIIMADMDKEIFGLNPSMQKLFNVKQETISFSSIEKKETNTLFFDLFKDVSCATCVPKEAIVPLQLPIRNEQRDISVRMIPLKDKDEEVIFVLMFVSSSERG